MRSKVFRNPVALREHLKNHLCGFDIDGNEVKSIDGIRGNNNMKYREKILINANVSIVANGLIVDSFLNIEND
jgi:hypothetical protein